MTVIEALTRVELTEQDFCALLAAIYGQKYTGMLILHCHEGVPKRAEFPALQVTLSPSPLDKSPRLG